VEKQDVIATQLFAVVLVTLFLSFSATGCGCQEHSVSEVTITPPTSCLTMYAGGGTPGNTKAGAVGLCESLFLFGNNACADALVVKLPGIGGTASEQRTAPAGSAFEIEIGGWSEQEYELEATLASKSFLIHFAIGGQCGLTGSCD
jgi:hypothetical protein